jgi:hypothetical protein
VVVESTSLSWEACDNSILRFVLVLVVVVAPVEVEAAAIRSVVEVTLGAVVARFVRRGRPIFGSLSFSISISIYCFSVAVVWSLGDHSHLIHGPHGQIELQKESTTGSTACRLYVGWRTHHPAFIIPLISFRREINHVGTVFNESDDTQHVTMDDGKDTLVVRVGVWIAVKHNTLVMMQ